MLPYIDLQKLTATLKELRHDLTINPRFTNVTVVIGKIQGAEVHLSLTLDQEGLFKDNGKAYYCIEEIPDTGSSG